MDSSDIQCTVNEAVYAGGPKPEDCEFDWANTEINMYGPAITLGTCRSGVAASLLNRGKPVLEYGTINTYEGTRCLSESRGLSCWETDSGHGFFASKSIFTIF